MIKNRIKVGSNLQMDWKLRLRILGSILGDSNTTRGSLRNNEIYKVHRASKIVSQLEGSEVDVHNGRRHIRIKITPERIGHRFGEFVATSSWALNTPKKVERAPAQGTRKGQKGKSK